MSKKFPVSSEQAEELVSRLYEQSSNEEPGAELDALVLQAAKESVEEEPKPSKQGMRFYKWQRYSSIAASVVIVITVGMLYQTNQQSMAPESLPSMQLKSSETSIMMDAASFADEEAANKPVLDDAMSELWEADQIGGNNDGGPHRVMPAKKRDSESSTPVMSPSPAPALREESGAAYPAAIEAESREIQFAAEARKEQSFEKQKLKMQRSMLKSDVAESVKSTEAKLAAEPKSELDNRQAESTDSATSRLNFIRTLMAKKQYKQAKLQLAQFKNDYPGYVIPEDLAELFSLEVLGEDNEGGQAQDINADPDGNQ